MIKLVNISLGDLAAFGQLVRTTIGLLTNQHALNTLEDIPLEYALLIIKILTHTFQFSFFDRRGSRIFLDTITCKHTHVDNRTVHARGHAQ